MSFCFTKMENRKAEQTCLRGWYQWEGEDTRKGCRRVNMVEILCTHISKWKMKPAETILGMEGVWIEEKDRGGEFNYDIL
jgi:hypothetical protein